MTTLAQATAAPEPLLKPDQLDQLLCPLDLGDLGEFEAWANAKAIADGEARVAYLAGHDVLTPDEKRKTLTDAFDSTKNGLAGARGAASLEGIRKLTFLSIRHRKPEITEPEVAKLVPADRIQIVQAKLDRLSGLAEPPPPPATTSSDDGGAGGGPSPNAGAASASSSPPPPTSTGGSSSPTSPSVTA